MVGIGIVGLPNVGKSTLFNAITKASVEAANYPFATIDKNVGVVAVPDERLDVLADLFVKAGRRPPIVPTTVEFVDIAGLVKGASKGEGLGNQFLAHIREVAAIAHVVRCFEDDNVVHVAGRVDPLADIETIETELALADLATLERRAERLRRAVKGNPDEAAELRQVEALRGPRGGSPGPCRPRRDALVAAERPATGDGQAGRVRVQRGRGRPARRQRLGAAVQAKAAAEGADVVVISAQIERELAELPDDEAQEFLADLGLERSGLERLIHAGYDVLGLITYLTASEKEVRAWTVPRGATAPGGGRRDPLRSGARLHPGRGHPLDQAA
jgi:ribosome-binding ATPase